MNINVPKKLQHVENVLGMIPHMTQEGKEAVIDACIKICLIPMWHLKKNRSHIQEIIKKFDKLCRKANASKYFSAYVSGFTFDWSAYDYRNCD